MCGLFYLRSCAGGTKTGLGNFEFFGIFGNCGGRMEWFERERKIFGFLGNLGSKRNFLSFLGNLSFLGFKRDGDMNLYYIKWKILPKMYFLLCIKRKICSTEVFSTHQMGRYDPIWSNGCKRTAGVWPKCRNSVSHGSERPL